jgi:hypothetical protein
MYRNAAKCLKIEDQAKVEEPQRRQKVKRKAHGSPLEAGQGPTFQHTKFEDRETPTVTSLDVETFSAAVRLLPQCDTRNETPLTTIHNK